jgi:hypothetical protein
MCLLSEAAGVRLAGFGIALEVDGVQEERVTADDVTCKRLLFEKQMNEAAANASQDSQDLSLVYPLYLLWFRVVPPRPMI